MTCNFTIYLSIWIVEYLKVEIFENNVHLVKRRTLLYRTMGQNRVHIKLTSY